MDTVSITLDTDQHSIPVPPPSAEIRRRFLPYPGRRAKLSQAFASYTVVFLLFSAYQLFRASINVTSYTARAEEAVQSECYALENTVTTLTSLPQFAAQGVVHGLSAVLHSTIEQIGYGLDAAFSAFLATLEMIVVLLTGTWRCFLANVSNSGIPLLSEIGDGGVQAIDQINSAMLDILERPFSGLPTLIQQKLHDPRIGLFLNVPSIPVQNVAFCDQWLDLVAVNELAIDLGRWIRYGAAVLLAAALAATGCTMMTILYRHRRRSAHLERIMKLLTGFASSDGSSNMERAKDAEDCNQHTLIHAQEEAALRRRYHYALQVTSMTRHPLLTRFLDWLSHHIFHAEEDAPQRDLLVWFGYYIAQPPAIACLLIGLLGLLTVYSQIAVINYSRSHFQPIMKTALEDLSDTILSLVDGPIHDASKSFAVETNTILSNLETDLNTNVFGVIVRAAGELNSGLAIVQTTLVQGVETVFGQGPFGKLILSVLQCLLFNKFHAVESGLIWLQDHAQIKFPRLSENVLVLEQNKLNDLIATATAAAVNDVAESPLRRSTPGNMNFLQQNVQMAKSAVDKVLSGYENDLREDLPVYYGLIGVWGMVLAMGLVGARVLWTRQ